MLRFDGQVVIVSGAGRGLGAAYAHLLAGRGAHVVVNDLGSDALGEGADPRVAEGVVDEITAAGGSAVPSGHDLRSSVEASAVVSETLDRFGRIDSIVHNAGINLQASFSDTTVGDLEDHLTIDPVGCFNLTKAAWSYFLGVGRARLVFTASSGMFGLPLVSAYGAAKGATWALARCLAAGAPPGIRVNTVAPYGFSRMIEENPFFTPAQVEARRVHQPASAVAPVVAALVHDSCPVHGELLAVGAGRVTRVYLRETSGFYSPDLSPEEVRSNWDVILGASGTDVVVGVDTHRQQFFRDIPGWADRMGSVDGVRQLRHRKAGH